MKSKIILVGGGGHCVSCIDVIEQQDRFQIAGVIDPDKTKDQVLGYPILGDDTLLPVLKDRYDYALVTIGQIKSSENRVKIYNKLVSLGFDLPVIISPRAYVSRHAIVKPGTIIMHHAFLNAGVEVGCNSIINSKALIEHDSQIGNHCHISTGAIVNGGVVIGQGSFLGSNSVIKENVKIGDGVFLRSCRLFSENIYE